MFHSTMKVVLLNMLSTEHLTVNRMKPLLIQGFLQDELCLVSPPELKHIEINNGHWQRVKMKHHDDVTMWLYSAHLDTRMNAVLIHFNEKSHSFSMSFTLKKVRVSFATEPWYEDVSSVPSADGIRCVFWFLSTAGEGNGADERAVAVKAEGFEYSTWVEGRPKVRY